MELKVEDDAEIHEGGEKVSVETKLCSACGARLSAGAEERRDTRVSAESQSGNDNSRGTSKRLVAALKFFGWGSLVAGTSAAIYIWVRFSIIETRSFLFFSRGERVINYTAVGIGLGFAVVSVAALILFLAVARILERVTAMRANPSLNEERSEK